MSDGLAQQVLILNRLWQAVNIVSARRAFALLMQDQAKAIHPKKDDFRVLSGAEWIQFSIDNPPADHAPCVHTVRYSLRVPAVLLLLQFDRIPTREVRFNRQAVFERDGYRCQYCNESLPHSQLNLDHVIPRTNGGRTSWENIVTSCISCNSRKANRLPHQAGMHLVKKPRRPSRKPMISMREAKGDQPDWQMFL